MKILEHIKSIRSKKDEKTEPKRRAAIENPVVSMLSGIKSEVLEPLKQDAFSPKILTFDMPGPWGEKGVEGKVVKRIHLKDKKGKSVPGYILQSTKNNYTYYACSEKEALCRMRVYLDLNKHMYIDGLYGQGNHGEYKGAGTELLKFAVHKSKKEGDEGRLWLTVGGSPKFYYKNNFRIGNHTKKYVRQNAALDFITRENLYADDVWDKYWGTLNVLLEKEEAKALLEDKRRYEATHSEYFGEKEIEYTENGEKRKITVALDFADLSNCSATKGICVAQAYRKAGEELKPHSNIEMRLLVDKHGDKYLHLEALNIGYTAGEAVMDELMKVVESKAQELGAKYIAKDRPREHFF